MVSDESNTSRNHKFCSYLQYGNRSEKGVEGPRRAHGCGVYWMAFFTWAKMASMSPVPGMVTSFPVFS